ncbi:MAG: histidinol dehydrogenase [Lachnoclostridium sp.]|nr:histidinol dehydrogenase [Lachnoclostridium sp.]MDD7521331.1 histidinol dehydrogenase [Lachnoclostridium sp.]
MKLVKLNDEVKKEVLKELSERSHSGNDDFTAVVDEILENVRANGDKAVFEYTKKFDGADISKDNFIVSKEEIDEAYEKVDKKLIEVIRKSLQNIKSYHERQVRQTFIDDSKPGIILGQRIIPLETVGLYVPGGKAAYPSSVLMNVVPAKVAGVKCIQMATPVNKEGKINPNTLVAANEAGVDIIYKMGGAQAIGAFAFGTEMVKKVDKICGPGNIFVALAKKAVYGNVSIDSIAGPSEVLVLADETANPKYVAADLLSQAEHDEMASAVLVTTSEELAANVKTWLKTFTDKLERKEIIQKSLDNYCYLITCDSLKDAVDMVNDIASEHLEIVTKDPFNTMTMIRNAGAIFLGEYSSEPLGDYFAGPNHVLPTNGTAKFFSPLGIDDFIKKSSIISYSKDALEPVYKDIVSFANAEGLTAHANSIAVRFED